MTTRAHVVFWVGAALALLALLVLLGNVLLPFVVGAGLAYLLDPVADRLERMGITRLWASLLILVVVMLLLALILTALLPLLASQLAGLIAQLPAYLQALRVVASELGQEWVTRAAEADLGLEASLVKLADRATGLFPQVLASLWSGGLVLLNFLALILITPIVAFYLLKDWDRMMARIDGWLPRPHASTLRRLAREIDEAISGFVRGQVIVILLLTLIYVTGLLVIGLNYGLLIGLGAGLISVVPYLGPLAGFLVGGAVALVQYWPAWTPIAAVIGVFVVGQFIEGNILSPLIVGDRVHLHPVWLILALLSFGYLFGFVGLLVAVPIAATIGVLSRFALERYLDSALYRGTEPNGPVGN